MERRHDEGDGELYVRLFHFWDLFSNRYSETLKKSSSKNTQDEQGGAKTSSPPRLMLRTSFTGNVAYKVT